jgi:putative endonuclease
MNAQDRGRFGENLAVSLLQKHGYHILERNYRSGRWGELDIICLEGGDLVFVEVKTRRGTQFGQPVEAARHTSPPKPGRR